MRVRAPRAPTECEVDADGQKPKRLSKAQTKDPNTQEFNRDTLIKPLDRKNPM